jgi:hypothetical protein
MRNFFWLLRTPLLVAIFVSSLWLGLLNESIASTIPNNSSVVTPLEHRRGLEQTFLTYPEWFLVFSPAEYAVFTAKNSPSIFPFFGHIGQFWTSYQAVYAETRRQELDLNPGYHLMIMVIGVSTTVEYALKAAYEGVIGRLSEFAGGYATPEDQYAAKVAQDYVDFIRVLPWYEYDFWSKLTGLWHGVPYTGSKMIRKWERRFLLTNEYLLKAAYAQLIKLGTKSVYDTPLLVTAVHLSALPSQNQGYPDIKILQKLEDQSFLVTIPRYEAFTNYANNVAQQGIDFREIAGNRSIILVSLLGEQTWIPKVGIEKILLEQTILTEPSKKRVVATVSVQTLAAALRDWSKDKVQVEHVFDY